MKLFILDAQSKAVILSIAQEAEVIVSSPLESEPFRKCSLVSRVFSSAMEQNMVTQVYCLSLDRLHLAAMAELGVRRLMTHDVRLAEGARELGYEVVMPVL